MIRLFALQDDFDRIICPYYYYVLNDKLIIKSICVNVSTIILHVEKNRNKACSTSSNIATRLALC